MPKAPKSKRPWAKRINPLASESHPCSLIRFIHKDGKEHSFGFAVNSMSGDRMSWWDSAPPDINEPIAWVKSVLKDIKAKAKVLEHIGDFS
jgi:hypothetical protein